MAIKLSEEVQDEIIDFSQEQYPNQTTGFLFGIGGKLKIANEVKFVNNTASDQIDGYQINEKDYLNAELYAVKNQVELLGVYHSSQKHFAVPTEKDLSSALPNFSYIKVSLFNRRVSDLKSWTLNDFNIFQEEQVKLPEFDFSENELQIA